MLELRIGDIRDALDRFEAAWNRRTEGRKTVHVLSVADLPLLLKTLTPARWDLLERLREAGPLSIYELARRLARDYKNVHTDVTRLARIGLIERAADVCLKERRRLILVPRETPYSAIHLQNMLRLTKAGAVVLPASPGFYHRPESIDELIDFVVGRVVAQFGIAVRIGPRWQAGE